MLSSGREPGPNGRCQVLEQLLLNKVMVAKAEIDSVEVDDARVEGEMERRMQYFITQAGSQEKLEQTLGIRLTDFKEDIRDQVREQLVVQTMRSQIMQDIDVTPAEIRRYYKSIPTDSIPLLPAEVMLGQVVISPEVSKAAKDKIRQQLLNIRQQVRDGASFADLAKRYSEDYGSAARGGNLGWHGRGELVPEFEATALQIDIGEISEPVESEFGFHLIRLLERNGNRFRAEHILIRPRPTPADIQRAQAKADSLRTLIIADSISFEKVAQEFSSDQPTRSNAGYFKDQASGSPYLSTDQLDPVVFFEVDNLKPGAFSEVKEFRTEDGKEAVRFLYLKGRKAAHRASLKTDYEKLYTATLNSKQQDMLMEWLNNSLDDVFIEIDPKYNNCKLFEAL